MKNQKEYVFFLCCSYINGGIRVPRRGDHSLKYCLMGVNENVSIKILFFIELSIKLLKEGLKISCLRKSIVAKMKELKAIENLEGKVSFLKQLLENENLGFESNTEWETLVEHVEVHKYYLNQNHTETLSWEDAVSSWKERVYNPLNKVIQWWEIKKAFSKYTKGQLLFAVSSHWYYMIEANSEVSPEEAADHFAANYGSGVGRWVSRKKLQPVLPYV